MGGSDYSAGAHQNSHALHIAAWVSGGISIGFIIVLVLVLLFCYSLRKSKKGGTLPTIRTPDLSTEIKEITVDQNSASHVDYKRCVFDVPENFTDKSAGKGVGFFQTDKANKKNANGCSKSGSSNISSVESGEKKMMVCSSPGDGLPEFSHLGWGHWFTLRDLEIATDKFSRENVIGEGGYGVVYRGTLINGTAVAVKRILNNLGQAEKEFRVEVEAIGHVRHKNLVRLLGYCVEGTHRLLVYEYVNNGNLEQWLHGAMAPGRLTWVARMKILLGTAKALAYLHDAIEPKVVHRDIKSSNILIDDDFNAKISDFGLAKLLGAGKSHIITRVMGTFGYVAPEYASSGFLNEKSDVFSFGVVLLEAITGREPVDDTRPVHEKNLVDWLKMMVATKRSDEVIDPCLEPKPSTSALKRALLTALRCVDPNVEKRPTMSQVVQMLESKVYPVSIEGRGRRRDREEGSI